MVNYSWLNQKLIQILDSVKWSKPCRDEIDPFHSGGQRWISWTGRDADASVGWGRRRKSLILKFKKKWIFEEAELFQNVSNYVKKKNMCEQSQIWRQLFYQNRLWFWTYYAFVYVHITPEQASGPWSLRPPKRSLHCYHMIQSGEANFNIWPRSSFCSMR